VKNGDKILLMLLPSVLETAPLLVVELVSEGSITTDYRRKRTEYANREIPEYWIIDVMNSKICVSYLLQNYFYVTMRGCICFSQKLELHGYV
jgi:hypothetical protein